MTTSTTDATNGAWLDFYALLDARPDADTNELRRSIGECYANASQNLEHCDLSKRLFYASMVERVLPQCRRVLLNPETRARYDEQAALHREGSPQALSYVAFMANLSAGNVAKASAPEPKVEASAEPSREDAEPETTIVEAPEVAPEVAPTQAQANEPVELNFAALPERVREDVRHEIDLARSIVETLEHGFAFSLLPSRAVSASAPDAKPEPRPASLQAAVAQEKQQKEVARTIAPKSVAPQVIAPPKPVGAQPTPQVSDTPKENAATSAEPTPALATPTPTRTFEAPEAKRPFKRNSWDSNEKLLQQHTEVAQIVGKTGENGLVQDTLTFDADRSRAQRTAARASYRSRVSLEDSSRALDGRAIAPSKRTPGAGILTSTARLLLTSLVAALFVIVLQNDGERPATASNRAQSQERKAKAVAKPRPKAKRDARSKPSRVAKKPKVASETSFPTSLVPESPLPASVPKH